MSALPEFSVKRFDLSVVYAGDDPDWEGTIRDALHSADPPAAWVEVEEVSDVRLVPEDS